MNIAMRHTSKRVGRKTEKVASPGSYLGFDRVERVVDTIATMRKRHQINDHQQKAADRIREATDIIGSSGLNGTLGQDNTGSGVGIGRLPALDALWAADVLAEVKITLGLIDGAVVAHVVGVGRSIEETALRVLGHSDKACREETGKRLRRALTTLADAWFPRSLGSRIRGFRGEDAKPIIGEAGITERVAVAHAGVDGVYYSKRKA